ncbi:MAG: DUF2062 domain-containing protein [Deltaproteobacteria bacterium]|nr:DUF2062 domain-containing protein [Deltaproteobacteria bacterium]
MTDFIKQRLWEPLKNQLKQGATPEKLAWSLAAGGVVGTFPVLGTTTLLGLLCGFVFRLNHIAVQVALNVTYPLQLLFLIPLMAAGGRLLGAPVPGSLDALKAELAAGVWLTIKHFAWASLGGILLWLIVALPLTVGLRYALTPAIRKFQA